MTTRAHGRWSQDPIPWERAAGRKPTTATTAETMIGGERLSVVLGLAALLGLGACGPLVSMDPPSPDGPKLFRLEFVPDRSSPGCRVELRLHVEPPHDEIVRAVAGWVLTQGRASRSDRTVLEVKPESSGDRFADDVTIAIWPKHPGIYWFHVQVEDRAGRRSNVFDGRMVVDPQFGAPKCS